MFRGSVGFKKDGPFIPTPGVYRNETDGLISFSKDGTNWITMKDKNIGATSTDTSDRSTTAMFANVGNLYSVDYNTPIAYNSTTIYNYDNFVAVSNHVCCTEGDREACENAYHWKDDIQGPCDSGWHLPDFLEMAIFKQCYGGINNLRLTTKYIGGLMGSMFCDDNHYGLGRGSGLGGESADCEGKGPFYKYDISQGGTITQVSGDSGICMTAPNASFASGSCMNDLWRYLGGVHWDGNTRYERWNTSLRDISINGDDIYSGGMGRECEFRPSPIYPIRPFKDTPVIPKRDWTVLYSTPQSS